MLPYSQSSAHTKLQNLIFRFPNFHPRVYLNASRMLPHSQSSAHTKLQDLIFRFPTFIHSAI